MLNYVIRNNKNVYICLDGNGRPVACSESRKTLFEYHKARNILDSLPKTLKKMGFVVDFIPEIKPKPNVENNENRVIDTNTYVPSENIIRWIEKIGQCEDVINEVTSRNEELNGELSNVDLKLQDILHEIEVTDKCDMFSAWKVVNKIREIRKKRRDIKNEMLILSNVLTRGIGYMKRDNIQKSIDGLHKRKYKIRIVEEEEEVC